MGKRDSNGGSNGEQRTTNNGQIWAPGAQVLQARVHGLRHSVDYSLLFAQVFYGIEMACIGTRFEMILGSEGQRCSLVEQRLQRRLAG